MFSCLKAESEGESGGIICMRRIRSPHGGTNGPRAVQKGKGSYKGNRASVAGILAVIKVVFWENVPHGNTMRNSQDFG